MKTKAAKFTFVLFWFTLYYNPYFQPYTTYFHHDGPCYGVGCPASAAGKQFQYPTGKS